MQKVTLALVGLVVVASSFGCGGAPPPAAAPPLAKPAEAPKLEAQATKTEKPKDEAPKDALEVAPTVHKKVFENGAVRIFEVTFKPGEKVPLHGHPNSVVYVISGGKLNVTVPDKGTREQELKAGAAVYLKAEAHSTENIGGTEVKFAMFELKQRGAGAAPKGADPTTRKGFRSVFENDEVRVLEATFAKGAKVPAAVHPEHAVYVLAGGKLKFTDPSKGKDGVQEVDLTTGFGGYLPAQPRAIDNVGAGEVKLVMVEMKPDPAAEADKPKK